MNALFFFNCDISTFSNYFQYYMLDELHIIKHTLALFNLEKIDFTTLLNNLTEQYSFVSQP